MDLRGVSEKCNLHFLTPSTPFEKCNLPPPGTPIEVHEGGGGGLNKCLPGV